MMKRSGRCATVVVAAVLWSVAATAQEPLATQEQSAPAQEQTVAAEEPAAAPAPEPAAEPPQEEAVEQPQRIVGPEEPAPQEPAPAEEPVAAPSQEQATAEAAASTTEETASEETTEAAEEPVIEEPISARFVNINDALPTRFFDAAATAPDPADPNRLVIGLHTDSDRATWKANDFRASTAAFSHLAAIDTISFRVEAPKGYQIAKITYTQAGVGSVLRVAKASGVTHWVVGDYAAQLGIFGTNPSLVGVADFSETPRATVDVSITTGLFAFAAATSGSASVEVTGADVLVELVPDTDGL
jgi:hypothetical protein